MAHVYSEHEDVVQDAVAAIDAEASKVDEAASADSSQNENDESPSN